MWSGAGSGCSAVYPKPAWQTDSGCPRADGRRRVRRRRSRDRGCGLRPGQRPQVGWMTFGGTSVAAPVIAGIYGANGGKVSYGSDPYAHTTSLFDVTAGSNGTCGTPTSAPQSPATTARAAWAPRTAPPRSAACCRRQFSRPDPLPGRTTACRRTDVSDQRSRTLRGAPTATLAGAPRSPRAAPGRARPAPPASHPRSSPTAGSSPPRGEQKHLFEGVGQGLGPVLSC